MANAKRHAVQILVVVFVLRVLIPKEGPRDERRHRALPRRPDCQYLLTECQDRLGSQRLSGKKKRHEQVRVSGWLDSLTSTRRLNSDLLPVRAARQTERRNMKRLCT